jgi:hypothetical protein
MAPCRRLVGAEKPIHPSEQVERHPCRPDAQRGGEQISLALPKVRPESIGLMIGHIVAPCRLNRSPRRRRVIGLPATLKR